MPFVEFIGEFVAHVRPVVHPFLEKGGETWQVSRAIKARQRELQARELGQNLANNPDQAEGTDNGGGDPAAAVGSNPGTGPDDPGGFLQDALDWFQNLF